MPYKDSLLWKREKFPFLKEKSTFETGFLVQFYRGFILVIQRDNLCALQLENMNMFC